MDIKTYFNKNTFLDFIDDNKLQKKKKKMVLTQQIKILKRRYMTSFIIFETLLFSLTNGFRLYNDI